MRLLLKSLGPGVLTGAADHDPSGIATYSVAGAQLDQTALDCAPEQLPNHVILCLLSAKGTRQNGAGSGIRRIEPTSCAVRAEGPLNATILAEVVTTFSSFQVP